MEQNIYLQSMTFC